MFRAFHYQPATGIPISPRPVHDYPQTPIAIHTYIHHPPFLYSSSLPISFNYPTFPNSYSASPQAPNSAAYHPQRRLQSLRYSASAQLAQALSAPEFHNRSPAECTAAVQYQDFDLAFEVLSRSPSRVLYLPSALLFCAQATRCVRELRIYSRGPVKVVHTSHGLLSWCCSDEDVEDSYDREDAARSSICMRGR